MIFLLLVAFTGFVIPVFGFMIHDLDYADSPYDNKKTPSLGQSMRLFYQVVNYTPKANVYDVTISITNLDEGKKVYSTQHQYRVLSDQYEDIIWNFTPETQGLYLVEVIENSEKSTKYVFAVPQNDELKKMAKKDPTILEGTSPRYQFRIGVDPKEIKCKEDLYLALKQTGLPVCVSLETLKEFRQRDFVVAEVINYEKIGHVLSERQFKKMLVEKNIKFSQDDFLLVQGIMLPTGIPIVEYCGYTLSEDAQDYWFSSTSVGFNLTRYEIQDENPEPCVVGELSCGCFLQTSLVEKDLENLSYFDKAQEAQVGKIFADFLNEGYKVTNVPNSFVIGKYNLEIDPDITSFCGQFQGKFYWYFIGHINNSKISSWFLETNEKPKLCAISENPQIFTFDESAIAKDSFTG
jgi:hypothetical protein